jgi:hypothetical protein
LHLIKLFRCPSALACTSHILESWYSKQPHVTLGHHCWRLFKHCQCSDISHRGQNNRSYPHTHQRCIQLESYVYEHFSPLRGLIH